MSESDYNCPLNSEKQQVIGKGGAEYRKHGAFCLETQKYADAIHHVIIRTKTFSPTGF